MDSDKPPAKVLPFERPRRFAGGLERLLQMLNDENSEFEDSEIEDGLACAEAAIQKGVQGGHEAKADLLNIRAHRVLAAGDADAALAAWDALIALYPSYFPACVARSELLAKRGDDLGALAELDRFVVREPTDPRGYKQRAAFHEKHGDADRALANLRRLTQLDPDDFDAHLSSAGLLAKKGDADGTRRAYAKYAEKPLEDVESYGNRGFLFFVSGNDDLALSDYETAVAMAPNDPDLLAWRGLCRSRLGRLDAAIADYTRLISMRPSEARGYLRRGEVLVRVGKHVEALSDLERAIALGGDDSGKAHHARGMAQQALGDIAAARGSYDIAIERSSSNVDCRLRRFQINRDAENWEACQIDIDAMAAHAPHNPSILLAQARISRTNGRRDDAQAAYDRLIELEPGNVEARYERADLHIGRGDYLSARADVARAFELAPNDPEIRAHHGFDKVQGATTEEERAAGLALIASTVELDPENPEVWVRAAQRFRQAGCPEKGIPFITRAIELDVSNPEYLDERSICIRCAASPADPEGFQASVLAALRDAERAIELSSEEDLERYRQRASLREESGDLVGALADLTTMIDLYPEFIDAHMDRARLRKLTGDLEGATADALRVREMEDELIAEFAGSPHAPVFERFNLDEA